MPGQAEMRAGREDSKGKEVALKCVGKLNLVLVCVTVMLPSSSPTTYFYLGRTVSFLPKMEHK